MGVGSIDRIPHPYHKERGMAMESLLEVLSPTSYGGPPVLGEDIPWKQVEGHLLRVRWCSFFASIEDGMVKLDEPGAYAALVVESPSLTGEALIAVSSKADFRHLWELYKERQVADDEEVLLFHNPLGKKRLGKLGKLMKSFLPCLDILVYPKGHLEEMYDITLHPPNAIAWFRDRAKWVAAET
jgi:hypothetical protein